MLQKNIIVLIFFTFFGLPASYADVAYLKEKYMVCAKQSNAVPSALALGLQNVNAVKEFMDRSECALLLPENNASVRVIKKEKAPLGEGFVSVLYVKLLEFDGENVESSGQYYWVGDIMDKLQ